MFRVLCLALSATLLVGLNAACNARSTTLIHYPHATKRTMTMSPHEHYQRTSNIAQRDALLLIEDLDVLFQTDRPSRLTRWHSK